MSGGASTASGKLGRYELHGAIARGGMATVYVARMSGAAGFARTVAVKRLHPHLAEDANFSAMFIDEARLAARIRHPNVIDTLDVVNEGGELFLVMDFVLGETLAKLVRSAALKNVTIPVPVVVGIIIGALEGLHAAHDATSERGELLGIVHRDISPQNILVARDGVARILDFGVAKAAGRVQETEGGEIKGKLAYMSPEQLTRKPIDRRCDLFAMGVVLWEALTTKRLFAGDDAASTLYAVMNEPIITPSQLVPNVPPALDEVVLKALERDPDKRFATAQEMAVALEAACAPAPTRHAGKWVEELAAEALKIRSDIVKAIDTSAMDLPPPSIPIDVTGGQIGPAVTTRLPTTPESWRHLPASAPVHNQAGVSGVSSISSVTSASGVSNASAPSNVTAHAQTLPANNEVARRNQSVKLAVIGGLFGAIAIVGITMMVVALNARSRAAAAAGSPSASTNVVAMTQTATQTAPPPTPVTAPPPKTADPESDLELPADAPDAGAAPPPVVAAGPATQPFVYTGPAGSAKTAKSAKPTAAECADPFTVDANGIKRPKLQCFGPR